MVMRSRLARTGAGTKDRTRLEAVELDGHKLYTFRLGEKKLPFGVYGDMPSRASDFISKDPPFFKILFPSEQIEYVRINWKTGELRDIFNKPIGKLPEKLKWEKYVPIRIGTKHPPTLVQEELNTAKQRAREVMAKRRTEKEVEQVEELLRQHGVDLPKHKRTLKERVARVLEEINV
jgi:hypothetical protein